MDFIQHQNRVIKNHKHYTTNTQDLHIFQQLKSPNSLPSHLPLPRSYHSCIFLYFNPLPNAGIRDAGSGVFFGYRGHSSVRYDGAEAKGRRGRFDRLNY